MYVISILYPKKALKKKIWKIIKQPKPSPIYATNETAKEEGMHLDGIIEKTKPTSGS